MQLPISMRSVAMATAERMTGGAAQEKIVAHPELIEAGRLSRLRIANIIPDRQVIVETQAEFHFSAVRDDGFGFHFDQIVIADQCVDVKQGVSWADFAEIFAMHARHRFPIGARGEIDAGTHDIAESWAPASFKTPARSCG